MKEIAISKFKATCLAVLEEVRRTGEPIRITRRGTPVAEVVPPSPPKAKDASWLGSMRGTAEVIGDIISPVYTDEELDEMEAEWSRNWDEITAAGGRMAERHRRLEARAKRASAKRMRVLAGR